MSAARCTRAPRGEGQLAPRQQERRRNDGGQRGELHPARPHLGAEERRGADAGAVAREQRERRVDDEERAEGEQRTARGEVPQ
jgi:hypothetical protein